ncbi:hypothetical protein C8A00DRAFT_10853 [Chaetomidium leptoderma]|uniref:Ribonuclease H2 subunit B n=1 Tax=Chaetomidium leptoderma TaxID=669021 RepID=A0AAN7A199_9PEZI|nr:hypothetical protein C8A00DRAFT_10853 [Chaetomidium leptoderma]
MAKTRSKGGSGTAAADKKSATTPKTSPSSSVYTLPAECDNRPKLFILPKSATSSARIVTLQHPRYNKPTRYLVCPEAGFFEFTSISPPKSAPRSWLIQKTGTGTAADTQITQSPALHLATPYDPLFLLLPALLCSGTNNTDQQQQQQPKKKRMFLSLDDHVDALPDLPSSHLSQLLRTCDGTRRRLEARLETVCDMVAAGDEAMYRVNETKLLRAVLEKAKKVVGDGKLPGSMEERFVRRELEAPVLGVRVGSRAVVAAVVVDDAEAADISSSGSGGTPASAGEESQESASSSVETAATSVVADEDVASAMTASEEVVKLQRLRVAFNFICSSYVAPAIAEMLKQELAKATLINFKPLDEYLERLAKLRQEAAAARTTDFSRKRAVDDEEEDERAEKRRKKEAEEKAKKTNVSRGVKNLMKVNTSGMKKMSDFFKKK